MAIGLPRNEYREQIMAPNTAQTKWNSYLLHSGLPPRWESCEPRLVLSAQLLHDILDPAQLNIHGAQTPLLGHEFRHELGTPTSVDPHTALAHQVSGWNAMQQQFGLNGDGQTVAVIDSGIAWDHVSLGKGYGAGYRVVGGWDFAENDSRPYDDGPTGFHGTHVAGIIGSDDRRYPGVAQGVDLVALRVFSDSGKGQIEWVEQALSWVHNNRNSFANPITTVNLSLGTEWNSDTVPNWGTLEDELRQLYNDGIVVTGSAGNSFKQYNAPGLSYPASSPYVLPVASVDDNGSVSDFSQRSDRALAAPGRNILSTVPDHVLGRDGKIDDFSTATGTSMASPYAAGASVLVREAMEMVGVQDVSPAKIVDWLHQTADIVFDTLTKSSYDRLNLHTAIDTLLPNDVVGDSSVQSQSILIEQPSIDGWLNHLGDRDVYRFVANSSGQLTIDAHSHWVDSLKWELSSNGTAGITGNLDPRSLQVQAGQSYELRVSADQEIGPFQFAMKFTADSAASNPSLNPNPTGTATELGIVDYFSKEVAAGARYRATAMHDGLFTVHWNNPDAPNGSLVVRDASGVAHTDATWENGVLRLDIEANAGQAFDIQLPGSKSDTGSLSLVDVIQLRNSQLTIHDTSGGDSIRLDLSRNLGLDYGAVRYEFSNSQVTQVAIDGFVNNDQLTIIGSPLADKVELKPGMTTLENSGLSVMARGIEQVQFVGDSGIPDRVYLYDSDGDDRLNIRPESAELDGSGYRFTVQHVDRIFVHATGNGQDLAYLYDSAGDDQLSVRPQFTSMWGKDYFNSIRGFERVYVYAAAGGNDTADLYDSIGNDRFSTDGETASIVGPGFFSYTRYFDQVHAHASAGGHDLATLYGKGVQTEWLRGSDFIRFHEDNWDRNAQGFESVESFISGKPHTLPTTQSIHSLHIDTDAPTAIVPDSSSGDFASDFAPIIVHANACRIDTDGFQAAHGELTSINEDSLSDNIMRHEEQASLLLEEIHEIAHQLANISQLANINAADELHWHAEPNAERDLLDEIFTRYGPSPR